MTTNSVAIVQNVDLNGFVIVGPDKYGGTIAELQLSSSYDPPDIISNMLVTGGSKSTEDLVIIDSVIAFGWTGSAQFNQLIAQGCALIDFGTFTALMGTSSIYLYDCFSFEAYFNNVDVRAPSVSIHNFSGEIWVDNITQNSTVSMKTGKLILQSTCTAGIIDVYGSCRFLDQTSGSTVNDRRNNRGIEETHDTVYVDYENGTNSTDYPYGTPQNPTNNLNNGITIAKARNITKILVNTDDTWITENLTQSVSFLTIECNNLDWYLIINLNGQEVEGSMFKNLSLTGSSGGLAYNAISCRDCYIYNITVDDILSKNCYYGNDIYAYIASLNDNFSSTTNLLNGGYFSKPDGQITIKSTTQNTTITDAGGLIVEYHSDITSGTHNITGNAIITDNRTGGTLNDYTINSGPDGLKDINNSISGTYDSSAVAPDIDGNVIEMLKYISSTGITRYNGTLTADGTEQTIYEHSDTKPFKVKDISIGPSNMDTGDTIVVMPWKKINSTGDYIEMEEVADVTYTGSGLSLIRLSDMVSQEGVKITIEQTAGTNRDYDWELFLVDG